MALAVHAGPLGGNVALVHVQAPTAAGTLLDGGLFSAGAARAALIAITGIHGNFYSNPFYFNIGRTLAAAGIDFVYAQTRDAFGRIETRNAITGARELIGSWNEDFARVDDDVGAWVDFVQRAGYQQIFLAGHSLGANKVIGYLSRTKDARVQRFVLLSPADVEYMTAVVREEERQEIRRLMRAGRGGEMLPFALLGWIPCLVSTAHQWVFDNPLDNVHPGAVGDFSQLAALEHTGALFIGSLDRFCGGHPVDFLNNINAHMPRAAENEVVILPGTGHTYQGCEEGVAAALAALALRWQEQQQ